MNRAASLTPRGFAAAIGAALVIAHVAPPAQAASDEYAIKAVTLFKLAHFVHWPDTAFASPDAPLTVAVFGENPFGDYLEQTVHGEEIWDRPLSLMAIADISELRARLADASDSKRQPPFHVLFVTHAVRQELGELLGLIDGLPVLAVGESDAFIPAGGLINLAIERRKLVLEIASARARCHGLEVRSQLLRISRVIDVPRGCPEAR